MPATVSRIGAQSAPLKSEKATSKEAAFSDSVARIPFALGFAKRGPRRMPRPPHHATCLLVAAAARLTGAGCARTGAGLRVGARRRTGPFDMPVGWVFMPAGACAP